MQIKRIIVDEIPETCGGCPLAQKFPNINSYYCVGIIGFDKNTIEGCPYLMKYRRSDCPLQLEEEDDEEPRFDLDVIGFHIEPKPTEDDAE